MNPQEFGDALKQLGMNDLSDEDIAAAFHVFDPDGSGIIELSELLNELRAEPETGFTRRTSVTTCAHLLETPPPPPPPPPPFHPHLPPSRPPS